MNNNRKKFQDLLRRLFQFDSADLDFGIYRIMNFKRDVVERFIEKDLLDAVSVELESGMLAKQSVAAEELEEVKKEIAETLGEEALDHDGNLAEKYKVTPLGEKYLKLKKKASGARAKPAVEALIFNHLHTFFSRYYDNGDFMSKRRYSKREKYAVPYNGEEVYLHWANKDQYYIKTGEHFTDYSFKSQGITVRFKLRSARVEQDNVKGDKRFFHIDEEERDLFTPKGKKKRRVAFIKAHPTLVLDTRYFDREFNDRLLGSFEDLDEETDGLLIHGENFQALNLLLEKYREGVKCIHIDPPYNTQTSGFLYKNDYQHSSWLAMMESRINAGFVLLSSDGSYLCHIDENEYERLQLLFEHFSIPNAGSVVWDKRNPMTAGRGVATQHEYIIWRSRTDKPINLRNKNIRLMLDKAEELIEAHGDVTEKAKQEYADWVRKHPELSGGEKAYRFLDEDGRIYRGVSLRAPEPRTDPKFFQPLIYSITGKPCAVPPNGFSRTPETLQAMIERGEIIFGPDETTQPQQKRFLSEESKRQISSVIQDAKRGKADLDALGLENFPYCHSVFLYMELLGAASHGSSDIIIDYFAGSGTTAHAVINLKREDGGRRRFILVEMGDYFDTVLLPRIKKVIFTPEWKDGKPKRAATQEEAERSPRIIKYMRLEGYEDALNNIRFDEPSGQRALQFDDYLLHYMLDFETKESETLLHVEKLASPFDYKLMIHDGEETAQKPVGPP